GLALLLLILAFSLLSDDFATLRNSRNIFNQITINTILAVGMTFVILVAGIDLSVGSVMAFALMTAGVVMTAGDLPVGLTIALSVLTGLLVGMVSGFFNGWVSERWRLPSFIVTLGMLNIARGAALLVTDAEIIYQFPRGFTNFGTSTILGNTIPLIFLVAIALVAISWFVLARTVFGRLIYAVGNNEEAVRLSGHNPSIYKVAAFTISGLTAGIAGIINMSRLTIASPIVGIGYELDAIAAVIIGGTSLFGGKGTIVGTFMGAAIIGVLQNGLVLMGVGDFLRQMFTGFVIILAVILDYYRNRLLRFTAES
ncbi:MAG TPA: ABC transporter permease, partial [Homoserinimonas sp.]|nr:ABC transporter permease [Homoserinimonas sp.]